MGYGNNHEHDSAHGFAVPGHHQNLPLFSNVHTIITLTPFKLSRRIVTIIATAVRKMATTLKRENKTEPSCCAEESLKSTSPSSILDHNKTPFSEARVISPHGLNHTMDYPSLPTHVALSSLSITSSGGQQLRSLSLSPTHLMGRRSRTKTPSSSASFLVPGPNMPFMSSHPFCSEMPVRFSEHQRAMEQAVAAERHRAKVMEAQEINLSADELRVILRQERHRMAGFARTIADLRSTAVHCQSQAEIHEEGRINSLLGRLETMQMDKGRIVNEFEREEEMLTNSLQKKLDQMKREKVQLERLIEQERLSRSDLQSKLTCMKDSGGEDEKHSNNLQIHAEPTAKIGVTLPQSSLGAVSEDGESGEDDDEHDFDAAVVDLVGSDKDS
jgi:hypothetical protein